jgi:hypothetical protein
MSEERSVYATGLLEPILRTYKRNMEPLAHSTSTVQEYFIVLEVKLKAWHDAVAAWSPGDGNGIVITCYPRRKASQCRFDRCHTTRSSGVGLILSFKGYVMVPVWLSVDYTFLQTGLLSHRVRRHFRCTAAASGTDCTPG